MHGLKEIINIGEAAMTLACTSISSSCEYRLILIWKRQLERTLLASQESPTLSSGSTNTLSNVTPPLRLSLNLQRQTKSRITTS